MNSRSRSRSNKIEVGERTDTLLQEVVVLLLLPRSQNVLHLQYVGVFMFVIFVFVLNFPLDSRSIHFLSHTTAAVEHSQQ